MSATPAVLLFLDIGPLEFILIAAAAVMLFGGDLPDVMRNAGRWVAKLRGMAADISRNASLPDDVARLPNPAHEVSRALSDVAREAASDPAPPAASAAPPETDAGPSPPAA